MIERPSGGRVGFEFSITHSVPEAELTGLLGGAAGRVACASADDNLV